MDFTPNQSRNTDLHLNARGLVKKNKLRPHRSDYWYLPSKADADFVAHMEDVLDVYEITGCPSIIGLLRSYHIVFDIQFGATDNGTLFELLGEHFTHEFHFGIPRFTVGNPGLRLRADHHNAKNLSHLRLEESRQTCRRNAFRPRRQASKWIQSCIALRSSPP